MSVRPVTVYVIACDGPDCAAVYTYGDPEPSERQRLLLDSPEQAGRWSGALRADRWIVTDRHLCPECAAFEDWQINARLALLDAYTGMDPLPGIDPPTRPGVDR